MRPRLNTAHHDKSLASILAAMGWDQQDDPIDQPPVNIEPLMDGAVDVLVFGGSHSLKPGAQAYNLTLPNVHVNSQACS